MWSNSAGREAYTSYADDSLLFPLNIHWRTNCLKGRTSVFRCHFIYHCVPLNLMSLVLLFTSSVMMKLHQCYFQQTCCFSTVCKHRMPLWVCTGWNKQIVIFLTCILWTLLLVWCVKQISLARYLYEVLLQLLLRHARLWGCVPWWW